MRGRNNAGFTLMEILMSISILALAAVIIYGSINTGLSATHHAEEKNELFQRVRIIREIIGNDISNAFVPQQTQGFLDAIEDVEGDLFMNEGKEFDFSSGYTNAFNGIEGGTSTEPTDRMEFYTISKGTFENDMPVYVSYYIDDDPLTEETGLVTERIATVLPAESFRKELAADVVGMKIRYLDSTPEGQEWVETWEEKRKLPRAVEVTLVWNEESRKMSPYTDVPILMSISSTHVF